MDQKKGYISKKYSIPLKLIKDNHLPYYYTTVPELCCKYDLAPIKVVEPYDYISAIKYLDNYYDDIQSNYFKNLLKEITKVNNDISKCSKDIAENIIFEYLKFRPNLFCLTIWPYATIPSKDITEFLKQYGHVYYEKSIKLTYNAALNLIYQLYSDTKRFPTIQKLKEKLEYLGWDNNTRKIRVIFFENTSKEQISGSQAPLKTKIRNKFLSYCDNKNLRGDDLVHINDHYYQTIEYSKLYLNKNSIKFLKKQNLERFLGGHFDKSRLYFNTIKKWFIDNVPFVDYDRYIFFGSLVLYLYGLRNCRDVDGLMVGSKKIESLIEKTAKFFYHYDSKLFYASLFVTGTKYWNKDWDTKDIPWLTKMNVTSKDQLVFEPENYFFFNGIKVLTIKNETWRKFLRKKPQDYADMIQMMNILHFKMNLPLIEEDKDNYFKEVVSSLEKKYNLRNDEAVKLAKQYY